MLRSGRVTRVGGGVRNSVGAALLIEPFVLSDLLVAMVRAVMTGLRAEAFR